MLYGPVVVFLSDERLEKVASRSGKKFAAWAGNRVRPKIGHGAVVVKKCTPSEVIDHRVADHLAGCVGVVLPS